MECLEIIEKLLWKKWMGRSLLIFENGSRGYSRYLLFFSFYFFKYHYHYRSIILEKRKNNSKKKFRSKVLPEFSKSGIYSKLRTRRISKSIFEIDP